ncbi:ACP phosphodiesterase [Pseudoalteromonas luteoviolacea]|uniref:ACP phosphodiesterase n=1 Tax=Pseudoalteromonas luteoviolacea TaxID=43657 RepID=A0A0C1Q7L2_9GAMM|nr:ACP phosphodiesterase [Pseudoalteromonas luteoviolacea]KID56686.1 ACP phosphodiesterase [Pseudoalteromonas luteoviolacea]
MNYLAHLFLAKETAQSYHGNLLGDFQRGIDTATLSPSMKNALDNHVLVDKFTDFHPLVKQSKSLFSHKRRRFSGIALDVLYDHLLIKHWTQFSPTSFHEFKVHSYQLLNQQLPMMHLPMQHVIKNLITNDWFEQYCTLIGTQQALSNIVKRVRFKNEFSGIEVEIADNLEQLEASFLCFFPELIEHIAQYGPENEHRL